MSETAPTDPIDAGKRKIDDALDVIEAAADGLVQAAKAIEAIPLRFAATAAAEGAKAAVYGFTGVIREKLKIEDGIGGDAD